MPKFDVKESIVIDAPIDKVYAIVRDFKQWTAWSPWLIADPEASLTYSDDGNSYSWEGPVTGVGNMQVTNESQPNAIEYRLEFIKPWKSTCPVSFSFSQKGQSTEATWTMHGSLPFFMFFMTKMMQAFVSMDYERGLKMLKDYVETGSVPSKLEFPGQTPFKGFEYVAVPVEGKIADIETLMGDGFQKLRTWLEETKTEPQGPPFSIYDKWDPVKGLVKCTLGFPVPSAPATLSGGLVSGEVPSIDVYPVRHTGPYRHLGNPWSAGVMHGRSKKFKQGRQIHPFEVYESDPDEVPENELVTVVNFPIKS